MLSDPISKRTLMDELLASVSPLDIRYDGELGDIFSTEKGLRIRHL